MQTQRRLLILSMGPFPTPEQTQVEGGGLRCWGLACGLRQNMPDLAITLSFLDNFKKANHTAEYQGFPIVTWNNGELRDLVSKYDVIITSYCLGDVSMTVAESLRADQQLILDCYVPIYVEASARDSAHVEQEYFTFLHDLGFWNRSLIRGDLFLCANPSQRRYYQGVLSALGRLNPITYQKQLLLEVPFGIHRQEPVVRNRPISRLLGRDPARKILWFGGIYPWFDLRNLIDAIALANQSVPVKLVIVGAKNPFTRHPDFLAKYLQVEQYAARPEHRQLVILQDWVAFDDRADWYADADLVVVVNKLGDENELCWRTRLADFVWGNVPIMTNGGDPLGESLIAAGAAARFRGLDPRVMAEDLISLLENPAELAGIRSRLENCKHALYWDVVTKPLAGAIVEGQRAPDLRVRELRTIVQPVQPAVPSSVSRIRRIFHLPSKVSRHIKIHGLRATAMRVRSEAARHFRRFLPKKQQSGPRIVVLAHQLDLSGAPFVLLDVLERIISERLPAPVTFFCYPPVHDSHLSRLRKLGLRVNLLSDVALAPQFEPGDVLLLNTVGFAASVRHEILDALERKRIRKVLWYIHEDEPSLQFCPTETRRIRRLMKRGSLILITPAHHICEQYHHHFGLDIVLEPYRIDLPEAHHAQRAAHDFDTLRFVLPGSFGDGRKGQLSVLYALASFYSLKYKAHPELYRDFSLTFIGLEEDFLSRQVRQHQDILGHRLICHPKMTRDRCLEIIRAANVTICYSLREALPVFVFEGMLAGHPILRNDCSGLQEQLEEGQNGFLLESGNFWHVVDTLERMLHRRKTTNEQLAAMSARSYEIALSQGQNNYDRLAGLIEGCFRDSATALRGPHFAWHALGAGRGRRSEQTEANS
jgi:glycosyltransferase involved in cell wall biosynthesis